MTASVNLHWSSASLTDPGRVRSYNEDACLDLPERGLWAVADGMGGHAAGDVASRRVVDALAALPPATSLGSQVSAVYQCLQTVNRDLCQEAQRRREQVIGSTVVVLLAQGSHVVVIWAGDSRAYRYRNGRLEQLTRDHSRVEEMVSQGLIDRDQAELHPAANIVTRAVGVEESLQPDSEMFEVADGDMFFLCSDGLTKEIRNDEIGRILAIGDEYKACSLLVERALAQGARDNVSVIVISAQDTVTLTQTQWNPTLRNPISDIDDTDDIEDTDDSTKLK